MRTSLWRFWLKLKTILLVWSYRIVPYRLPSCSKYFVDLSSPPWWQWLECGCQYRQFHSQCNQENGSASSSFTFTLLWNVLIWTFSKAQSSTACFTVESLAILWVIYEIGGQNVLTLSLAKQIYSILFEASRLALGPRSTKPIYTAVFLESCQINTVVELHLH